MSVMVGAGGIAALFALILLGVNVMVALGAVGVAGLAVIAGPVAATSVLSTVFFDTTHSFHFSVIPLFLLMGYFALRAGLGSDVFEAAQSWLGGMRGGLAISTTLAAAGFGAASGSSVGTATVFTKIALPEMLARGYDKRLASASIAIAGTLAVMIPPQRRGRHLWHPDGFEHRQSADRGASARDRLRAASLRRDLHHDLATP